MDTRREREEEGSELELVSKVLIMEKVNEEGDIRFFYSPHFDDRNNKFTKNFNQSSMN